MKDEKNKQQPQQSDTGQKKATDQQGSEQQGKQGSAQRSSDHQPQHSSGQQPTGQHPTDKEPSKTSQGMPRKDMEQPMDVREGDRRMESNVENPDQQDQPGKKANIDDDPDQTKKKVPNMHK